MELTDRAANKQIDVVTETIKQVASLVFTDYAQRAFLHAVAASGHVKDVNVFWEGPNLSVAGHRRKTSMYEPVWNGLNGKWNNLGKQSKLDEHPKYFDWHKYEAAFMQLASSIQSDIEARDEQEEK